MAKPRTDRKAARIAAMQQRQKEWQTLSPKEQLKALDKRLGKGKGAAKQRARLAEKLTSKK
jgi:hypothetical protein